MFTFSVSCFRNRCLRKQYLLSSITAPHIFPAQHNFYSLIIILKNLEFCFSSLFIIAAFGFKDKYITFYRLLFIYLNRNA